MRFEEPSVYTVEVADVNGDTKHYTINLSSADKVNNQYMSKRRKLVFSYVAFFTLTLLMASSFFVKCSTDKDEYKNGSSYEFLTDTVEIKNNNSVFKKYDNSIPFICMTFFCSIGIVFLGIILIKDDDEVRFSKLNSLLSLKEEFDSQKNYEQIEECKICPLKKDADDLPKSCCCKTIAKKKNLYGELSKVLINSIAEI